MSRKSVSKKVRFEVFKRDGFACQYCGRTAPDVVLHVDHIVAVADGGGNEVTNLVSACEACNLGKGATPLSDDSTVTKQRRQMKELQARREMIEMMAKWRIELDAMKNTEANRAAEYFYSLTGYGVTENGLRELQRHIRKFGFSETLEGISIACDQYIKRDSEGVPDRESVVIAWKKVGGICFVRAQRTNAPWLTDFYKLRAAGRRLFGYWNDFVGCGLLRRALEVGHSYEDLRAVMSEACSWSAWKSEMAALVDGEAGQ